jgi:hypothetical protein
LKFVRTRNKENKGREKAKRAWGGELERRFNRKNWKKKKRQEMERTERRSRQNKTRNKMK